MSDWLGLVIGNSRLHWAWFVNDVLESVWDTDHLSTAIDSPGALLKIFPPQYQQLVCKKIQEKSIFLCLASVVPKQTLIWRNYPTKKVLALADLPLKGIYPSLGIDRALAVCGAGKKYGYPCLVIDAGTALTLTGVDRQETLIGGAILPGLGLQLKSLHQKTAALPQVALADDLPTRWALSTEEAISSGIVYTLTAGIYGYIEDWLTQYPDSSIIFTGGDSQIIVQHFNSLYPRISELIVIDQKLIFWGLKIAKENLLT